MALVKCPDCGAMVSSRAAQCPRCGCPQSAFLESSPIAHSIATAHTPISPYAPKYTSKQGADAATTSPYAPKYTSTTEPSPSPKKESGGSSKMIWILLVLVMVIIVAIVLFTLAGNGSKEKPKPKYEVGDYYNCDGKEGVVYSISGDGSSGHIISLYGTRTNWDEAKQWCRNQGSGWYLPTMEQLKQIYAKIGNINATLEWVGDPIDSSWHWSSTEDYDYDDDVWFVVDVFDGDTDSNYEHYNYHVRAVSSF